MRLETYESRAERAIRRAEEFRRTGGIGHALEALREASELGHAGAIKAFQLAERLHQLAREARKREAQLRARIDARKGGRE